MKIHFVTIGKPKLEYAKLGWEEYMSRLQRMHAVRVTQLPDKFAYNENKINEAVKGSLKVILEIDGLQSSSHELATLLNKWEIQANEVSFIIGGPDGLPQSIRENADYKWSLGKTTLPHDLAMVVTLEALYRASTINAKLPYHR
jgi:23S rRNA (pseudouridine1915-N3)-methyltransferase